MELSQKGLADDLFALLKQLSPKALHSKTTLQFVIDLLDKKEYRTTSEVKELLEGTDLKEWLPPDTEKTIAALRKLFAASSPTTVQPNGIKDISTAIMELEAKLKLLKLKSIWIKEGEERQLSSADDLRTWFAYNVEEEVIQELERSSNTRRSNWPTEVYRKSAPSDNSHVFISKFLDTWLRRNGVTLVNPPLRADWQEFIDKYESNDGLGNSDLVEYLCNLSQSSLVDLSAYSELRDKDRPQLPPEMLHIVKANQTAFNGTISEDWLKHPDVQDYLNMLKRSMKDWSAFSEYLEAEAELVSGMFSTLLDWFFLRCPRALLVHNTDRLSVDSFRWRREVKDPTAEELMKEDRATFRNMNFTMPDGRLAVDITHKTSPPTTAEMSMIYVEDKAKYNGDKEDNANALGDRKTVLMEAQRALALMSVQKRLSRKEEDNVCVVAIHTQWPRLWVYGVSITSDGYFVAHLLGKYNLSMRSEEHDQALQELCLRILLLLKRNIDVLAKATANVGKPTIRTLLFDIKGGGDGSGTATPEQAASTPEPKKNGGARSGRRKGEGSVRIEKYVLKASVRESEELRILSTLGGRNHLPKVLTDELVPSDAPEGAFVMQYYADRSIRSVDEARVLVAHVAEALQFLHSCGYVHCDVKRSNVRFDGAQAILIDLDVAVPWQEGSVPLKARRGTPAWLAPELYAEPPSLTSKVDLWGLGLVLFDELLALLHPRNALRVGRHTINMSPSSVCALLYDCTEPEAVRLVLQLLNEAPSRRIDAASVLRSPFVAALGQYSHVETAKVLERTLPAPPGQDAAIRKRAATFVPYRDAEFQAGAGKPANSSRIESQRKSSRQALRPVDLNVVGEIGSNLP